MFRPNIKIAILGLVAATALSCSSDTVNSPHSMRMRGRSASLNGDSVSYTVQGFTSMNGQFLDIPPCLTWQKDTLHHVLYVTSTGDTVKHRDVRTTVNHNGTCGAPSPYNGGWINVYEVDSYGDHYVGQVYGDMVWREFRYEGPSYKTIKLRAYPDQMQGCQFDYWEIYGTQNPITVTGEGTLPLAYFSC